MDIWSSKGVQITGPSIKFTGHSQSPQRRHSDSDWSFGSVMNNLLLEQTNFYWRLPHVKQTLGMTAKRVIRICKLKDRQHNGQKKKDKQWSTKHAQKTKDRVTRTPIKTRDELRFSGKVSSSCSTSGTHRVNLVTNLVAVISHEWGKVFTANGTYSWSLKMWHRYSIMVNQMTKHH